jgi:hypothetical protein
MNERQLIDFIANGGLEKAGIYLSAYKAIVVDNNDPDKLMRIKVKCPVIYGDVVPNIWISQRGTFAGANIGFFALPNVGDAVYLTFLGGDVAYPLWEFSGYIKGQTPEEAKENYPDKLVIKRGDLRIELDTKTNKVFIGNDDYSLNEFFTDLMTALLNVKTSTMLGPQPFINIAEFTQIKTKIENILS